MQIEEKKLVGVQRVYHFKISINNELYFFIVITETSANLGDKVIITIKRGSTYWDCQKKLKASQKKEIKRMIERMF